VKLSVSIGDAISIPIPLRMITNDNIFFIFQIWPRVQSSLMRKEMAQQDTPSTTTRRQFYITFSSVI
jgi:hypothetical protein